VRRRAVVAVAALVVLCLGAGAFFIFHRGAAGTPAVSIANYAFHPARLIVRVGQTVTWTNRDQVPHTTTSAAGIWDSGTLPNGRTFSITFRSPGTYAYRCSIHPNMQGTVVVQPVSKPSGS
jgi:plastocyanin